MDVEKEPKRFRIVSGDPATVELECNAMFDEYTAFLWNFAVAGDKVIVTALLLHQKEIEKQQRTQMLTAARNFPMRQ